MKHDVLGPDAGQGVCPTRTGWHRLQCARRCAQTRSGSGDHQSAANANHEAKKKGPEIVNSGPFVTPGSLSKPLRDPLGGLLRTGGFHQIVSDAFE